MGNSQITGLDEFKKNSGKLLPPEGRPKASEVSENYIILSWQPAKHPKMILAYIVEMLCLRDKKWVIVTNTCQSTSYKVRNLKADTEYVFRIRSQNIYEKSKPGRESYIYRTKPMNYVNLNSGALQAGETRFVRNGSLNSRIDGSSNKILQRNSMSSLGSDKQSSSMSGRFQRDSLYASLPPMSRKHSTATLLPGLRRESVCSVQSLEKSSDIKKPNRDSLLEDSLDLQNSARNSSDYSDRFSDVSSHTGSLSSSGSDYDSLMRSSRKRAGTLSSIHIKPCNLHVSTLPDDVKVAMYVTANDDRKEEDTVWEDRDVESLGDFRTLRNILNSSEMLIKPCEFIHNKHKLTTISDEDEEIAMVTTI